MDEKELRSLCKKLTEEAEENDIYDFFEDLSECPTLDNFESNATLVKEENLLESHRWYILQRDVYEYNDRFIGVWKIRELSESMDYVDTEETLSFVPMTMKEVRVVDYVSMETSTDSNNANKVERIN